MLTLLRDRINVSWLLLVTASFVSWETGQIANGAPQIGLGQLAIGIAFAKVVVVGQEFMELRLAPPLLRWLFQAWALIIAAVLILLYSRYPV